MVSMVISEVKFSPTLRFFLKLAPDLLNINRHNLELVVGYHKWRVS